MIGVYLGERLTKFHGWRVFFTRYGWNDSSGRFHWNGNFTAQFGPIHINRPDLRWHRLSQEERWNILSGNGRGGSV